MAPGEAKDPWSRLVCAACATSRRTWRSSVWRRWGVHTGKQLKSTVVSVRETSRQGRSQGQRLPLEDSLEYREHSS